MAHITPDIAEAGIITSTIQFAQTFKYNLEWHREHADRRKED